MTVSYDLSGRTAIVTGGARGIGRAVATALAAAGAEVTVWDIDPVPIEGARSVTVDITRPGELAAAISGLGPDPRIDILVNDAGELGPFAPFEATGSADWQRVVGVNLLGTMEVTRQVLPAMRRAGRGRIVNLGSLAGKEGLAGLAAYSAASAGVIAFTKALAREVVDQDIRVNCVAPGPIDTRMIRSLGNAVVDQMIEASPLRRLGTPEEVADLILWLASEASFTTGAVFDVSGGRARY